MFHSTDHISLKNSKNFQKSPVFALTTKQIKKNTVRSISTAQKRQHFVKSRSLSQTSSLTSIRAPHFQPPPYHIQNCQSLDKSSPHHTYCPFYSTFLPYSNFDNIKSFLTIPTHLRSFQSFSTPFPFNPSSTHHLLMSTRRSTQIATASLANDVDDISIDNTPFTKKGTSWLSKTTESATTTTTITSTIPKTTQNKRKRVLLDVSNSSSSSSDSSASSSSSSTDESEIDNDLSDDYNKSKPKTKAKATTQNKKQKVIKENKTLKTTKSTVRGTSQAKPDGKSDALDQQDIEDLATTQSVASMTFDQLQPRHIHMIAQYLMIRKMRHFPGSSAYNAPVDSMGCAVTGDRTGSPKQYRFETLISLMLSAQTKDATTFSAVNQLRTRLPGGLTPANIISHQDLAHDCIKSVGFHNTKIKNIIKTSEVLIAEYDSDIPHSLQGLLKLPGVGPKMGILTMQAAFDDTTAGIGVDVHVHRIAQMLKFCPTVSSPTPEKTRLFLEKTIPSQYWNEINWLIVGFGQTICPSLRPRCGECWLARTLMCPNSTVKAPSVRSLVTKIDAMILRKDNPALMTIIGDHHIDLVLQPQSNNLNPPTQASTSLGIKGLGVVPLFDKKVFDIPSAHLPSKNSVFETFPKELQLRIFQYVINEIFLEEYGITQDLITTFLTADAPSRPLPPTPGLHDSKH